MTATGQPGEVADAGRVPGGRPPVERGTLAERAAGVGYRAAWKGIRVVPGRLAYRGAAAAAERAFRRRGPAVRQYERNLRRVLGAGGAPVDPAELDTTLRAGLRSYARYWVETFRLPSMDHREVVERSLAGTAGLEHIAAAHEAGRGVVVALPHSGNWDVGGLMLARAFGSFTTVAERLRPQSLYDAFFEYRQSLGMEILPLGGGGATSQTLKERLRAGGIVCLVADRDLSAGGIPVTFFGEQARMPAGPSLLAAVTGADLCVARVGFSPDGWWQRIGPPLTLPGTRLSAQVREGTQLVADLLAAGIAAAPSDWHMLQPLWTADLGR